MKDEFPFGPVQLKHRKPVILREEPVLLDKGSRLFYQAGAQQFFHHCQDPASANARRLLLVVLPVADHLNLHTLFCDLHILDGALRRPHAGADVHALQGRSCRAGTAQDPPVAGQNDLAIGTDINKQNMSFFLLQFTHIGPCHNICPYVGRHLGKAVKNRIFSGFDADPGCRKFLCLRKLRPVRGPADASCVYSQQHVCHGTVSRHIDFPDFFSGNARLFADLPDHAVHGLYDRFLKIFHSGFRVLIFISDPGQHIQTVMLLGIDHGRACQFLSGGKFHQRRHHRCGADVDHDPVSFVKMVFFKCRDISLCQHFVLPLIFQKFHFHGPVHIDHAGQADPGFYLFRFQKRPLRLRHGRQFPLADPHFTFAADSLAAAGIIHKCSALQEGVQEISALLAGNAFSCLSDPNSGHYFSSSCIQARIA